MNFTEFKNAVVTKAQALGITEYELYYQFGESAMVQVFHQEVDQFAASAEGGVCFRCIVNGKMGYASTEVLSEETASAVVARAADNAAYLESEEQVFLADGGAVYEDLAQQPYDLPGTDEMVHTALDTQKKLYAADPAVVDGSACRTVSESVTIAICNSKGLDVRYHNNMALVLAQPVVERNGEKSNDLKFTLGKMDTIDTQALTRKAVDSALSKLGGEPAPTGSYPVIFAPEAMSNLLSVYSSVFSAEAAHKGLSRLAGKEGEQVASNIVTLVDDPFHKDNPMPIHFDAEGSPTYRKNIIENGVLKTLLYNLKSAAVAGKTTTGNAAKANYDSPVGLRPFTMYLAPGEYTQAQLLKKAGNGVLINALEGLHAGADPVSGDFSLQSAGFLIEEGVMTRHVKSFTVAGNFYQMLRSIVALSDTVELPRALGKTAFGSPCVLVEGLSVAGK